jgi:protein-L-isoaspartate(D-aspartate) O-methyltransferase
MVREQIVARGVRDARVLAALIKVPRERFVPAVQAAQAFHDAPLPIGHRQTISQPYIVAYMLEQLWITPSDRVLEVGAGSGYVCALLAELAAEVCAIERVGVLARQAQARLTQLGYSAVRLKQGNGYEGWLEHAPFNAILVSASARDVPQPLLRQLALGGRMVLPVGGPDDHQRLLRVVRTGAEAYTQDWLQSVSFVPLVDDPPARG